VRSVDFSVPYYNNGQLAKLTDSDGQSFGFAYNAQGLFSQLTDEAGRITTYTYDSTNDELVSVTGPGGKTSYTYDSGSNIETLHALLSITNPDATHLYFSYDAQGRLIGQQQDGGADAITYAYDVGPGGYRVIDATGASTSVLLNDVGEAAQIIDPLGRLTDFGYDAKYNLVQVIAPTGLTTNYQYDSEGNAIEQIDPLGNTTEMTYDPTSNRLTSLTDARGNTTYYSYDAQANLRAITYPDSTVQQFSYDPLGNVAQSIDQNGDAIGYTYDSRGLATKENFADGTQFDYTYDDRGNMLTATDSSGTITMQYDTADRLTMVSYPNGLSLTYSYDAGGRRIRMVDQTGFTVNYAYAAAGRLAELKDGSGDLIVNYTYDAVSRLAQKDMGNGTRTVYSYDGAGEVLSIINDAPDHVTVNSFDDYTYDGAGNVITDTNQDGEWSYSYDADGQLIHAVFVPNSSDPDGLTAQDLAYAYDPAGNRTSVTANGVTTVYATNNMNEYTQVGSATYSYDRNGNLVSIDGGGQTSAYTYDDLNQLISAATLSGTSTYQFNPLGGLVGMTDNGKITRYMVDPTGLGNIVGEFDASANLIAHYAYGIGLTSRVDPEGESQFYDFDASGSTVGVSNSVGAYVNSYGYLPFGEQLVSHSTVSNPFGYVGRWGVIGSADDLSLMGKRFFDTTSERFLTTDPVNPTGVGGNRYTYGGNNPTTFVDPSGLFRLPQFLIGSVQIAAAGIGILFSGVLEAQSGGSMSLPAYYAFAGSVQSGLSGVQNIWNSFQKDQADIPGGMISALATDLFPGNRTAQVIGDVGDLLSNFFDRSR
jgi:RHS repeat-associated protein